MAESVGERSIGSNSFEVDSFLGFTAGLLIEASRIRTFDNGLVLDWDSRDDPGRLAHPANIAKRTIKHWILLVNGSRSAVSPKNIPLAGQTYEVEAEMTSPITSIELSCGG